MTELLAYTAELSRTRSVNGALAYTTKLDDDDDDDADDDDDQDDDAADDDDEDDYDDESRARRGCWRLSTGCTGLTEQYEVAEGRVVMRGMHPSRAQASFHLVARQLSKPGPIGTNPRTTLVPRDQSIIHNGLR